MSDNNQHPKTSARPQSYLVLADGTPVYDRAGDSGRHGRARPRRRPGRTIFHGLLLKTADGHRFVAGGQVDGIFEHGVIIAVPADELPEPSADAAARATDDEGVADGLRRRGSGWSGPGRRASRPSRGSRRSVDPAPVAAGQLGRPRLPRVS